jgi:hypothetical protein
MATRGEGVNGSRKFLSKYFGRCPKSPPNTTKFPKLNYSNQKVTRALRKNSHTNREPTQKTELKTEHNQAKTRMKQIVGPEKFVRWTAPYKQKALDSLSCLEASARLPGPPDLSTES